MDCPLLSAKEIRGITTMPHGSRWMWGTGLSVTWPPEAAVVSPPILATRAWAASWQVVEKRNEMYQMKPKASSSGERSGIEGVLFFLRASRVEVAGRVCKGRAGERWNVGAFARRNVDSWRVETGKGLVNHNAPHPPCFL